jgi:ABC-type arginine/histidine transport system permease subunit
MLRVWMCAGMQVLLTTLTVGTSLSVALAVPDQAEKIYAVVGSTAVCVVCYVIPVYIQLQLYRRRRLWFKQHQVRAC